MTELRYSAVVLAALLIYYCLFAVPYYGMSHAEGLYGTLLKYGLYVIPQEDAENEPQKHETSDDPKAFLTDYGISPDTDFQETGYRLPLETAKAMNFFSKENHLFNIRSLSFIYVALFIIGLSLFIRTIDLDGGKSGLVAALVSVLILCDIGYLAHFNSLRADGFGIALLSIILPSAVLALTERRVLFKLIFAVSACAFVYSFWQGFIMAAVLAAVLIVALLCSEVVWDRVLCAVCAVAVLVYSGMSGLSVEARQVNLYHAVFLGAVDSPRHLNDMGLSQEFYEFVGKTYYELDNQQLTALDSEFYGKISYGDIVKFYALHPGRFIDNIMVYSKNAPFLNYGNEKMQSEELDYKGKRPLGLWGYLRTRIFVPGVILLAGVVFLAFRKSRRHGYAVVLVTIMLIALYVTPVVSYGKADITGRLLMYNFVMDMLLIWLVLYFVDFMKERKNQAKLLYETNR